MRSGRNWTLMTLSMTFLFLVCLGLCTVVVDPFFHYHPPLDELQYPINNERYQNNGIVRNFKYDAIITGTSMTENFKTTEFDKLFGVESVKVPFSGASYKEIGENLQCAIDANPNIRTVLLCLDSSWFAADKDKMAYDSYPTYLYDNNLLNDVYYIFNKEVLLNDTLGVLSYTNAGFQTTSFDFYANWMEGKEFGKKAVLRTYQRPEKSLDVEITEEEILIIKENISQNILSLVENNAQITFLIFFPPYSILYWDLMNQCGLLEWQLDAEKIVIEMLVEYDNIKLSSFFNNYNLICDLENYKDMLHYGEDINSKILLWVFNGDYQITKDNYQGYCEGERTFYLNYDYEKIFIE